jgi:hypothetical protein
MPNRVVVKLMCVFVIGLAFTMHLAAQNTGVTGTFVLGGVDAKLAHVRVMRTVLDEQTKKAGYAILMSAKPVTGDIRSWQTANPAERGSFVFLVLESTGDVWIAELGHAARKDGRFGVVTELKKAAFAVKGDRLTGRYRTNGEESFGDSKYTIDLTFDASIEGQ